MTDASKPPESQPQIIDYGKLPVIYRPWFPVTVAAAMAGLLLLLLLIPGVLRYPEERQASAAPPALDDEIERRKERNQSLREQIGKAETLIERQVCVRDGAPFVPAEPLTRQPGQAQPGQTQGGAQPAPGAPPEPAHRPVTPDEGGGVFPIKPEKVMVPPNAVPSMPAYEGDLAGLLDKATVFIITAASKSGTGFFVAPNKIITNRHVVESAANKTILVANLHLGKARSAKVLNMTAPGQHGAPDYALLEMEGEPNGLVLAASTRIGRLQRVVAAGYPGLVISADEKLKALLNGDISAVPQQALTPGTITVVQNRESASPLIGHEAYISPGNSGGPLVDECGRIVGVNTYFIMDEESRSRINYALAAASLISFLEANNVTPSVAGDECRPAVASNQPPGGPAAPGAEAPKTQQ